MLIVRSIQIVNIKKVSRNSVLSRCAKVKANLLEIVIIFIVKNVIILYVNIIDIINVYFIVVIDYVFYILLIYITSSRLV